MIIEKLPQKETLTFSSPREFGLDRLADYYGKCTYGICEYSVGIKLMWSDTYRYAFAESDGCLICRDEYEGIVYFDYPIAGEGGDIDAALQKIEEYCLEEDIPLRFTTLPATVLGKLAARYDGIRLQRTYLCKDYIYHIDDIKDFAGKKYAGQRNHIRRFRRNCPDAVFRKMTAEDLPALDRFMQRFNEHFQKQGWEAMAERESAFRVLHMENDSIFRVGCMEYQGEIIGVALGEKCGDTLVEHIEKALTLAYEGIYPALFQEFVNLFGTDCTYVNREDDAADRGLRTSKLQYHPCRITQKYDMNVENLLSFLREFPTLESDRLTLDRIRESDAEVYAALCMDDQRNRYWGYDYRSDLPDIAPHNLDFCRIADADFEAKRTVNFAVRRCGEMIGEVVLYRFDNKGGAELGVRILPAFAGNGYGREAFSTVADWALYELGVTDLHAKCFRENTASARMLSELMKWDGEDERMLYFVRRI